MPAKKTATDTIYMQGEISFNSKGNRVTHIVGFYQYRIQGELMTIKYYNSSDGH